MGCFGALRGLTGNFSGRFHEFYWESYQKLRKQLRRPLIHVFYMIYFREIYEQISMSCTCNEIEEDDFCSEDSFNMNIVAHGRLYRTSGYDYEVIFPTVGEGLDQIHLNGLQEASVEEDHPKLEPEISNGNLEESPDEKDCNVDDHDISD